MKKIAILVVLLGVGLVVGLATSSNGSSKLEPIIALSRNQAKALKQVDDNLVSLKKQFDDLQTQRAALVTGFALSNAKTSGAGLDWPKKYNFEQAASGEWGFRELTAEEQQVRSLQQQVPPR